MHSVLPLLSLPATTGALAVTPRSYRPLSDNVDAEGLRTWDHKDQPVLVYPLADDDDFLATGCSTIYPGWCLGEQSYLMAFRYPVCETGSQCSEKEGRMSVALSAR